MKDSAIAHLKSVAPKLLKGETSTPTPILEQRAIAILKVLEDYEWHTSVEIAQRVGIGRKYAADILRVVANDWSLMSQRGSGEDVGWKMIRDGEPIII